METLPKLADSLKRLAQGGTSTEESKFTLPYLYQVIHEAKATALRADFIKTRRIQAVWALPFYPDFDSLIQDDPCVVKIVLPSAPIELDSKTDGLLYVGERNGLCAFRKVNSQGELANINAHFRGRQKDIAIGGVIRYVLIENVLTFYGDLNLQNILVNYIPQNPQLLPTYNLEQDFYPVDDANLLAVKTIAMQNILGPEAKTFQDQKMNMVDNEGKPSNVITT